MPQNEIFPFYGDFIGNDFVKPSQPSGSFESVNPANLKDVVLRGTYQFDRVHEACMSARSAFRSWAELTVGARQNFLAKLKEAFIAHADELAAVITREMGKPLWEAQREVRAAIKNFDSVFYYSAHLVDTWKVDEASKHAQGSVSFKPRGVMAVIGPFNFPVYVPIEHMLPALITGNTVVFKPSEWTPAVGQVIAQLFEKARFPKGVFNMVQGSADTGKRLVMHETVEGVLFTGSYETGFKIKQDTLPHFWKITALQMGGKNAAIVFDDANIKQALQENLIGSYITSGQRCTSTSRVILMRPIANEFIEKFHQAAKKLMIGPGEENPFMGPLISGAAVDKYLRFQGIAIRENCEQIMRGKQLDGDKLGHFVTPSIYVVRRHDPHSVYQKTEVFGPNVAIYIVDEPEQALDIINSSSYGLSLSVFSRERSRFEFCRKRARIGMTNWNLSTVRISSYLPFGGMGKSGNGNPSGSFEVFNCTYPVASLEAHEDEFVPAKLPGFFIEE